jgi:hexokinase
MISGMYLGELTRNVILYLVDQDLLFKGRSSAKLNRQYEFDTSYMSMIEADDTSTLERTRLVLEETLELPATTFGERRVVQHVCQIVCTRAARLSAAALVAVVEHCGIETDCSIGIDGSLFLHYPGFEGRLRGALADLLDEENAAKIRIAVAEDGSGIGAGMFIVAFHTFKTRWHTQLD